MRSSKSGGTNALVGNGARTWNCLSPSPSSTPIELMCVAAYLSPGSAESCGDLEWSACHSIGSSMRFAPSPSHRYNRVDDAHDPRVGTFRDA